MCSNETHFPLTNFLIPFLWQTGAGYGFDILFLQFYLFQKNGKRQNDMSIEDMYKQYEYDEEDDDDSDWEPLQKHIEVLKWFCANCTMVNFDDAVHCDVCFHNES